MRAWVTCARCGGEGVIGADLWTGEGPSCDGCGGAGIKPDDGQTGDLLRALTITGRLMRSPLTPHTARQSAEGWRVSWLPERRDLTRAQATAAMLIAEVASQGTGLSGDPLCPHIDAWADELGLTGPTALARASEPADC